MAFVTKPDRFGSDAIIQGRVADPHGFVTNHDAVDGLHGPITLYFSVTGLRQLAAKHPQVGLVLREEADAASAHANALQAEVDQLRARVAELEAREERIAGLSRDGFKVQRVMGRPTKEKA